MRIRKWDWGGGGEGRKNLGLWLAFRKWMNLGGGGCSGGNEGEGKAEGGEQGGRSVFVV